MNRPFERRQVLGMGLGAVALAPLAACATHGAVVPGSARASAAPPAVWPRTGKHPLTSATQFVLLDKAVRFLPNAPASELKPGQSITPPEEHYPDNEINMHNDGFHIAFIANDKEPYWNPSKVKPADSPDSWYSPINFYGGTIYYRTEVFEKPDDKTLTSLIARITTETHEGTNNVWLGHGVVTFDQKGIHHFDQPVKAFRPFDRYTKFRFDKPLYELQLIVADSRGAVVHKTVEQAHNAYQFSPELHRYLPLKVRYTAVVVAEGAVFAPPAWW